MATSQRMPQLNMGLRVLVNHQFERAVVSDLHIDNKGLYKIWRFDDGYSVLKYRSAVIACYSPILNEVTSINTDMRYFKRAIQKYTIIETRE